ncbi:jerky protein homolog-like isoform X2 [Belonocnema kinseyi]|uniref:jerky protein homolog-like isoform X2 n=1 Tax=Belonocnema kinseyi TaxID=2817044 RepID=UPI00143DE0CE|nr:jerky protein homolog-like isoform X2 [Belonocnema kinseyi]
MDGQMHILAMEYGISDTTLRKLLAEGDDLNSKSKNYEYLNKKSSKTSSDVRLDAAVFEWFKQARDRGDPITGPFIQEKARILNEKFKKEEKFDPQKFKASTGWLRCFKKRYGIRGIRLKGETLSNDPSSVEEFAKILKSKIESENLKLDNIYNADESGIFWRLLMACTFALQLEEEENSKREQCNERVTALFCANSSGSHRIPLLMIGKSEIPGCLKNLINETSKELHFKNLERLGVIYTHENSAWMDKCIFLLWYKEVFIPRVLEHQRKNGITGKVVLILDNAPCHPSSDELNAINENFEVVYLPPNVTALIQPMDQELIMKTKKLFKKDLLRRILLSEEAEGPDQFLKELDLPDCFEMMSLAWNAVQSSSFRKAWKPLLGNSLLLNKVPASGNIQDSSSNNDNSSSVLDPLSNLDAVDNAPESTTDSISFPDENCNLISELLSGPDYSVEKTREFLLNWFENDQLDSDCGWKLSSDSDLINFVTNIRREPQIATKTKNSETMFGNSDTISFVTCGRLEPEIVPKIENRETMIGNTDFVNFVTCGKREPEITAENENSETMFGKPDIINFITCDRLEPEIVPKIENSETVIENPELMELTPSEGKPEIINQIGNSGTVVDNPQSRKITSSEAFVCLMKLKDWVKSEAECLPKLLDYIREMEEVITERTKREISQNIL